MNGLPVLLNCGPVTQLGTLSLNGACFFYQAPTGHLIFLAPESGGIMWNYGLVLRKVPKPDTFTLVWVED